MKEQSARRRRDLVVNWKGSTLASAFSGNLTRGLGPNGPCARIKPLAWVVMIR